ncbi:MAG TPA: protocatechuate 3,4-dioxygenase subunit alpha [Stellaceae bacterium]|nr:protocatechuate 3,4-dioxygenase subunit alpha [Stellaceae bacterium]
MTRETPSQTVGPFFAYGLVAKQYGYQDNQLVDGELVTDPAAQRIRIVGQVIDGEGNTVPDALVEIWQADPNGKYNTPGFNGFGRQGTGTNPGDTFVFDTVKPGSADGQAPHVAVVVLMRGLLSHLFTRIYFADEAEANARDPVLNLVPEDRRGTLVAWRDQSSTTPLYRFDIRLQGENETVFFDV